MDPARQPRSRSRQSSTNALRSRTQPPIARHGGQDQEYTPLSSSHNTVTEYDVFPVRRHGTPTGYLAGHSQPWDADTRATPPPFFHGSMGTTGTGSIGQGRGGGKSRASGSPVVGKSKRVRTGCLTCRERHLKCDEGVPDCNNCRKSNRECKRGLRLNWIEIKKGDSPCISPAAEWSVQILDESRSVAAEYEGGLALYPSLTAASPPELNLEVPSHDVQLPVLHFENGDGSGDAPHVGDQCHPNHVGQPPPQGSPDHHQSPPGRPNTELPYLTPQPRPGSQPGHTSSSGDDGYSFPPLRDLDEMKGYKSHPLSIGDAGGQSTTPQLTPQPTGPQPPPHEFRAGSQAGHGQHFGTQTGLMTPSSENTTDERDYLSTDEEIHFMQVFIDNVSIWMDALDKDKHFANVVPYLALKLPMLLNALLACGARHLTLTGQHDGEKADYYYNMATTQLSRSQQERERDPGECALTAVVLDAYHVMSGPPTQRMGHIASTRALIRGCGWDASSTGLAAACFWVNVGMEVLSCIAFGWPTAWDPDQWGLDLSFATFDAASRSGSRSVAGSDDLWTARAEGHPAVNDNPELGEEELWVQRIFYVMAKVANFRANTPQFQEPSPHDEQVRLQNRFAEWRRLQNMCNTWNLSCPRSMRPYGYSPGPSPKSLFPNVWLIKPPAKLARLFYHTAMCLLAQVNPLDPRDSREKRAAQLHHAHHVCGIAAHTCDRAVVSVAIRSLAVVGAALADPREQDELLAVLARIQRETGWKLTRVVDHLRGAWGRDAGGSGPSSAGTATAGHESGVLAPLPAVGCGYSGLGGRL